MSEYPKAKYRKSELGDIKQQYSMERYPYATALVKNSEEEEKLGKEWFDSPALALADAPVPPEPPIPAKPKPRIVVNEKVE